MESQSFKRNESEKESQNFEELESEPGPELPNSIKVQTESWPALRILKISINKVRVREAKF